MRKINKIRISFLLIFLILGSTFLNAKISFPKPTGYTNDFAGVLSQNVLKKVNDIAIELKQKTGFELTLAIVKDLQGEDYYTYANKLYAKWGIGDKNDAGVLLLIAVKERKLKIEVGYGAEGFLPDGLCGEIADNYILPYLNNNDYNQGVLNGMGALASVAAKHYNVTLTGVNKYQPKQRSPLGNIIKLIIGLLVLSLFLGGRIGLFPFLFLGGLGGMRGGSWSSGSGGFGGFGGFGGGLSGGGGVGRSF